LWYFLVVHKLYRFLFPLRTEVPDPLYEKALAISLEYDRMSAFLLQRHLAIGYARAAKLLDELRENGIIEHGYKSNQPRKVLKKHLS